MMSKSRQYQGLFSPEATKYILDATWEHYFKGSNTLQDLYAPPPGGKGWTGTVQAQFKPMTEKDESFATWCLKVKDMCGGVDCGNGDCKIQITTKAETRCDCRGGYTGDKCDICNAPSCTPAPVAPEPVTPAPEQTPTPETLTPETPDPCNGLSKKQCKRRKCARLVTDNGQQCRSAQNLTQVEKDSMCYKGRKKAKKCEKMAKKNRKIGFSCVHNAANKTCKGAPLA